MRLGRTAEVVEVARALDAVLTTDRLRLGSVEEGEGAIRLVRAEALDRAGDRDGACRILAVARDRLFERAARISSERLRGSFLANVPEHAATLRLAAEWRQRFG